MYIPEGAICLDKVELPQIRLGIQGFPKTGKTFGGLTFPNPVVASLDRGLGAHTGRPDVWEVRFYDEAFCKKIYPKYRKASDLKDTIQIWLEREAIKLTADQTLVFDGGTGLQHAWNAYIEEPENKPVTKSGAYDDFAPWRLKIAYFADICAIFKTLKCHVVYICHESEKKDKSGEYTGKIRPLLTGQFVDELASHFTDWVRQGTMDIPAADKIDDKLLKNWGMSKQEFVDMCNSMKPGRTLYFWQTEGDNVFDGGVSSLVNYPRFIPANFESFTKYMKHKKISVGS